jgi:hypothetical protein
MTGSSALVVYQLSPEPIASIPPVHADPSRTNGFVGYCVPPYTAMTYNTYHIPPQTSGFSYGLVPSSGYLQQPPYGQPNHAPHHMSNTSNSNTQKPNDPYYKEMLQKT